MIAPELWKRAPQLIIVSKVGKYCLEFTKGAEYVQKLEEKEIGDIVAKVRFAKGDEKYLL